MILLFCDVLKKSWQNYLLVYERVRDSIGALAQKPRPPGCVKLTNREGWCIRVGDYRVIYEIDDQQKTVTILNIGARRDYR